MKRIEAVIRTEKVTAVKDELVAVGQRGITVMPAQGHGIQCGVSQKWRGDEYVVDLLPKSLVIVVVEDHLLRDCIDVITRAARTNRIGDGKIFVTDVEQVVRVRTSETGHEAL